PSNSRFGGGWKRTRRPSSAGQRPRLVSLRQRGIGPAESRLATLPAMPAIGHRRASPEQEAPVPIARANSAATSTQTKRPAMRKWMSIALLSLSSVAVSAGTPLPDAPHVVVHGEGKVSVVPDSATVTMVATHRSADAA